MRHNTRDSRGKTPPESHCPWTIAHLCLQRPQVEDVEVTRKGGGQGHKRAQGWQGWLLQCHWHDQGLSIQVHGGDVAQQGGEADGALILHLPSSTWVKARPTEPPFHSALRPGPCQHSAHRAAPVQAGPPSPAPKQDPSQLLVRLQTCYESG